MSDLPHELTLLVLRSLPPRSLQPLGRLCCTCRALRRAASTSALWRTLCHGIFAAGEVAAAGYAAGAPQWRDACRQLLFERARNHRWKARQRLEEAAHSKAAAAAKQRSAEVLLEREQQREEAAGREEKARVSRRASTWIRHQESLLPFVATGLVDDEEEETT